MTTDDMRTALRSIPAWARIAGGIAAAFAALMAGIAALPAWDAIGIASLSTLESRIKPLHDSMAAIRWQGHRQEVDAKETRRVVLDKIILDLELMIRQNENLPLGTRLQLEQQLSNAKIEQKNVQDDLATLRRTPEFPIGR